MENDRSPGAAPAPIILSERWHALWQRAGGRNVGYLRPHLRLCERYSEPHRAYHTLDHVKHCLFVLDVLRHECPDPNSVEMAIWFHDAVYDPRAGDNEERSADLARQVLDVGGFRAAFIDRVADLVLATRHAAEPIGRDAEVLADVDLAILGEREGAFEAYEDGIRREYSFVSEQRFADGRIKVLERFLERPRIYATAPMRASHEASARRNIRRSLARLYTKVLPVGGT